jgi:hypothetical protein
MKMSKTNDEAEVIDVLVVANDDNHEDGTGNAWMVLAMPMKKLHWFLPGHVPT